MRSMIRAFSMALLALVAACGGAEGHDVKIQLVSDIVPQLEASRVVTRVLNGASGVTSTQRAAIEVDLLRTMPLARGVQAASLTLPDGEYSFAVELYRPSGERIAARTLVASVKNDQTFTVFITADCVDVECPNAAGGATLSACLRGTCVDPRCSQETPEHCPENFFCNNDDECSSGIATCAQGICNQGVCVETPKDNACASTEYCARGEGCAPIEQISQPPGDNSLCGRVCALQDAPCWYGYYACDDEKQNAVCTRFVKRPEDAPCGDGAACDENGECVAHTSMDGGVPMDAGMDATITDGGVRDAAPDAPRDARADAPRDAVADAPRDMAPDVYVAPSRIRFANLTNFAYLELVLDDGATTIATTHCQGCAQPYHVAVPSGVHDVVARDATGDYGYISARVSAFDIAPGSIYSCVAYGESGRPETLAVTCVQDQEDPPLPSYRVVNLSDPDGGVSIMQFSRAFAPVNMAGSIPYGSASPILASDPEDSGFAVNSDLDSDPEKIFIIGDFESASTFTNIYLVRSTRNDEFTAVLHRAEGGGTTTAAVQPTTITPLAVGAVSAVMSTTDQAPGGMMYNFGTVSFASSVPSVHVQPGTYYFGSSSVTPHPDTPIGAGLSTFYIVRDISPAMAISFVMTPMSVRPYWFTEGMTRLAFMHSSACIGTCSARLYRINGTEQTALTSALSSGAFAAVDVAAAPMEIGIDRDDDGAVDGSDPTFNVDFTGRNGSITVMATYYTSYGSPLHLVVRYADGTVTTIAPNS